MNMREVSFDGRKVAIEYEEEEIRNILDFLFLDLNEESDVELGETLKISRKPNSKDWRLAKDEKSLFKGENLAGLAVILMGETLFHLIRENDNGLAVHAGLVSDDSRTILIPGSSGSGKTSVTTWLLNRGMRYHTDELVTINLESHSLTPFTRPLNIKTNGVKSIKEIIDLDAIENQLQISTTVTMIPHRLVNPDFRPDVSKITHIIFPKYIADSKSEVIKLSGAETGMEMMRSNVIARNLPSHGFSQVTKIARDLPAYRLHYQHFDDLPDLISDIL